MSATDTSAADETRSRGVIRLLCDIAELCDSSESVRHVLQSSVQRVCRFNGWSAGAVHLCVQPGSSPAGRSSEPIALVAAHAPDDGGLGILRSETAAAAALAVLRSGRPAWRRLERHDPLHALGPFMVGVPLEADRTPVGAMQFFGSVGDCPDEIGTAIESIALQLGHVVERRRLHVAAVMATNRERQRIAQTLHDTTCQELAGLALSMDRIVGRMERGRDGTEAREIAAGLRQALEGLRSVLAGLVPPALRHRGLCEALADLARFIESSYQVRCTVSCDTVVLSPHVAAELHALASEAVSNAARHGRADEIAIELRRGHSSVTLEVRDNGIGLPPRPVGSGLGLSVMRYRAAALDGRLAITSAPSRGTIVRCEVPRDVIERGARDETDAGEAEALAIDGR